MKIVLWIYNNILFLIVTFLLIFIPLYPKKPLLDVVNTWVYIRAEDFIVLATLFIWIVLLIRKKITLQTPLTIPIFLFWIFGAISTIHGVILIFPEISNVFPNVAFLHMLRRIEYVSLFFVAYAAMKERRAIPFIVAILAITLFAVVMYGLGQKYYDFPAYLTMNEEFAKGIPIKLSPLSRIPSTFGGHYDLAAYLVLVIPILTSMVFGFRNWIIKVVLLLTVASGFVLLFMTVSRVSFFVLLLCLAALLFVYKKRWVIFSLPFVAIIFVFLSLNFSSSLLDRFDNTIKEVDILVNAQTGEALGGIKEVSPPADFRDKIIIKRSFNTREDLDAKITVADLEQASTSAIVPFERLPIKGVQLLPLNASTGENLPQGTGYINLPLSPVQKRFGEFFYQQHAQNESSSSSEMLMFSGNFLVKRDAAYDLSFTTRYQGEWPNAINALKRNVFLGSGYSSISLAIDNNYLRILGEIGILGLTIFFVIFITAGIYIKKVLPKVDSPVVKSFVIGFFIGVSGLALNAIFIDVFEASKVAFYLWLLMGVTMGALYSYQTNQFVFYAELKKVLTSRYAIIIYLGILNFMLFSPMLGNYFVGDDFTWLRWVAECGNQCPPLWERIFQYFTQADGFFYRPGTKMYFLLMHSIFWLNPVVYHAASLLLHFIVVVLVFLVAQKILRDPRQSTLVALLFTMLSGYTETIFWISSIGHIFSVMFVLFSILFFILWHEKRNIIYFIVSLLSMGASLLFHELGVITPLLILLCVFTIGGSFTKDLKAKRIYVGLLFAPIVLYLAIRFIADSHWSGGDYSYNLLKLPFNFFGNIFGYSVLSFFGGISLPFYELLRNFSKANLLFYIITLVVPVLAIMLLYHVMKKLGKEDKKVIIFAISFIIISLLPFLGLGNITSRYTYLASFGFVILFAFLIKKLYAYMAVSGRDIAVGAVTLLLSLFFLLHIIQVQKAHGDWHEAGLRVNRLFISLQASYSDYWSTEPMELHFVNMPIRTGEAWVFPVGVDDALWFIFKNPNIYIQQWQSVDDALNAVNKPRNEKVFEFDDQGRATERKKNTQDR